MKALLYFHDTEKLLLGGRSHRRESSTGANSRITTVGRSRAEAARRSAAVSAAATVAAAAPFVQRWVLPVLNDLSLTVKLKQEDHENYQDLRLSRNCCSQSNNLDQSRNLASVFENNMLAPPQILLHSTSLDHEDGKIFFFSFFLKLLSFEIKKINIYYIVLSVTVCPSFV